MLATDVSAEMIAIAREKLKALPMPMPQLRFEVADADAPVGDGATYDAVLAFNLMHLVSDLDAALDAVVTVLKPGGAVHLEDALPGRDELDDPHFADSGDARHRQGGVGAGLRCRSVCSRPSNATGW